MNALRTLCSVVAPIMVSLAVPAMAQTVQLKSLQSNDLADEAPAGHSSVRSVTKNDSDHSMTYTPENRRALVSGSTLIKLERYDDAIKVLTAAIANDPKETRLLAQRADAYAHCEQYAKAIDDYNKLLTMKPRNAPGYCNRGKLYEKLGDVKKAVADYSSAIALGARYHDVRARLYIRREQWQLALADLTAAMKEVDEGNVMSIYTDRAKVYDKLGKAALAEKDRMKAKDILNGMLGSNVDAYPDFVPTGKKK